mgnify:FL=1
MFKKKNKYSAIKQIYNGRTYHSKKECEYAKTLDWRKRAGEIKEIIPQYKLELKVNGIKICNYYMDFKVIYPDESVELIEIKGYRTGTFNLKWKLTNVLLNEIEPNAKLTLVL